MLCRSAEYEAHFCVCESGLHRVHVESLLLAQSIDEKCNIKINQIGSGNTWSHCSIIWAIHSPVATGLLWKIFHVHHFVYLNADQILLFDVGVVTFISIQTWIVPRVLGTKFLGNLQYRR